MATPPQTMHAPYSPFSSKYHVVLSQIRREPFFLKRAFVFMNYEAPPFLLKTFQTLHKTCVALSNLNCTPMKRLPIPHRITIKTEPQ